MSDREFSILTEASEISQRATELLDRASSDPDFVEQANRERRRKRGRNARCWCGSGRKYKGCHWERDRAARTTGRLPAMSDRLERLCSEFMQRPGTDDFESYRQLLALAGIAWNRSRKPPEKRRDDLSQLLRDVAASEDIDALVEVIDHLTAVAEQLAPHDPRFVVGTRLVDRGTDLQILVSYTRPG